ncbi:MAG: hypothetical protein ACE1Y2_05060 [Stenotrophomonas maltophilia]
MAPLLEQRFQAGVVIFGKHQWLRHGEVFSVVFEFISRFSVTDIRVAEPMVCRDCTAAATCRMALA